MIPVWMQLAIVFIAGVCLGSLVNWAVYSFSWWPRWISPWSRVPEGAALRGWSDRLPVAGWWGLRREAEIHGRGFWVRPLLVEIGVGLALAGLYWWEVQQLGLVRDQAGMAVVPPRWAIMAQFVSHTLLLGLMLAASFIDIDEKIVPDEITVPGTLLGLVLAAAVPMSLLPQVADRVMPPVVGEPLANANGGPAIGPGGGTLWIEPVQAVIQPDAGVAAVQWPPAWLAPRHWQSLVIGLACFWLWGFALVPRIWRGRRGVRFALLLIARRVVRELMRPPLRWILLAGTLAIVACWLVGRGPWAGLLTALVGLVGGGGIVWAVRIIGTAALRREAMGFGDVTLMMMIGTFLGWQASIIAFFMAPFAGLVIGILQFILRRDDVIPYAPYLCLGAATVVVAWAPIWTWALPMFQVWWLVPAVLAVCLVLLGLLLLLLRLVKTLVFGIQA